jgi:hypothetical protein
MGPFVVLRAHLEKWNMMRKPAMDVNHTSGKMEHDGKTVPAQQPTDAMP